jgi:hypothetical protein
MHSLACLQPLRAPPSPDHRQNPSLCPEKRTRADA